MPEAALQWGSHASQSGLTPITVAICWPSPKIKTLVPNIHKRGYGYFTHAGDINHIFPEESAGESHYPRERICSSPEGCVPPPACTRRVGVIVPSHTVSEFHAPAFRIAASSSQSFFAPSVVSIGDTSQFARAVDSRSIEVEGSDANPDGLGLARGIRSAIVIQGCIFLMGYGIWHLWHLAH